MSIDHENENHESENHENENNANNSANNNSNSENHVHLTDMSLNTVIEASTYFDASNVLHIPTIVTFTLNETIDTSGTRVVNQQGESADGIDITHTTFETTDTTLDVNISQNLVQVEEIYENTDNTSVLNEIKLYASKIQCDDFHGKGTIDDYTGLFEAAARIANETKQMQLDVDIEGFSEFANAADDLSALFTSFIVKLQNVNIINDLAFLTLISIALKKIYNLSEVFGRFKETILATSTIQVPKSIHDTSVILSGVMDEVNCAMNYISYFVNPDPADVPHDASLDQRERDVIDGAIRTIDNWNLLCEHGVTIAMANDDDIKNITTLNNSMKTKTALLQNATNSLRNKLLRFNV